jgi:Fe-S oxidoreductase
LIEYIKEGRIKLNKEHFAGKLVTVHDPCNYGRKSQKTFGKAYYDELRWVVSQCTDTWVDTYSTRENNYCCGAGGGAWAMPYAEERIYYGRKKADQIKQTGAEIVVAPCHNCRDQIMKSLTKEYELPIETLYIWEMVADSLIIEPWSEEEIAKAEAEAAAQWEAFGVVLDEEEMEEEE